MVQLRSWHEILNFLSHLRAGGVLVCIIIIRLHIYLQIYVFGVIKPSEIDSSGIAVPSSIF